MKILSLTITRLHGYINTSIDLNHELAILVGINGSGKTSALNVLNWMFNLDIAKLTTEHFDLITINFSHDDREYSFSAKQNDRFLTIDLRDITERVNFPSIIEKLNFESRGLINHARRNRIYHERIQNDPSRDDLETWIFIRNLEPPMIIGLDRNLYTSSGGNYNIQRGVLEDEIQTTPSKITPLKNVSQILRKQFATHTNQLLKLNRKLNETIVLSAFDDIYTSEQLIQFLSQKPPTVKVIETLQNKVVNFLNDNHNWNSRRNELFADSSVGNVQEKKIQTYFNKLKQVILANEASKEKIEYVVNISQFKKVNELIKAFSDFEKQTQEEIAPLNEFIEIINGFLKDSAKQLYFEKESGLLRYNIIDKKGNILQESMSLHTLSSGEKQILILLTYIKYRSENLFLIDEPELSLHIKWQEEFLNAINKIKRPNTQLIIATHSPEIIGDFRKNCTVLIPYAKS